MAEPLDFKPTPVRTQATAREELDRLVETLHRHGVLRLANDAVAANQDIAAIVVKGLETEGARNLMQNLSALAMVLGKVPPGAVYKFAEALREAARALESAPHEAGDAAPGVRGVYRLLNDDELWQTLAPLARAVGVFGRAMARPTPEKPITAHSGKQSDA
ncbi:DUF1641 domain-containing protein [Luteibacter yeojuensis]|uniref:DUF1641 domain-containing protein n=1 Tax=Luteibacter yeojuensis TaxID=345309 RepID=A0A7X5QU63_9GAMM|nr:DUF1641 domain-containing protein [Luteibacter yeojuensis]NID15493.1 DUF1641 domain-containing protein [Luteibacter yeojuensis]